VKLKQFAKDSTIYGGADLITSFLYFFSFPIIAAALSPKAFGALELILTFTGLFGLVMNFGLNHAVQRFYWDKDTNSSTQSTIIMSGFCAQLGFGFVGIFLGLAATLFVLPLIQANNWPVTWLALVAAVLVMALTLWHQYILDVLRLKFAPWKFFTLTLITKVVTIGFGLLAILVLNFGIDGLLVAQMLVLLLVSPLALLFIRQDLQAGKVTILWMKKLLEFGSPFIFVSLAYWLFGAMDRWMLASMTTIEEVGVYSVAFRFVSAVVFVSAAFGKAWAPVVFKLQKDYPKQYRAIYGEVLLFFLFFMLTVGGGLALFSGEMISLIMPSEYHASAIPLSILCFGVIIQSMQQITAVGISLEKKTYLFARLAWLTAAVNFVANWLLIPSFGAAGAAWGTLISYIVLTGSYFYYTQKHHPLVVNWRSLISIMLLGTLMAIISIIYINISLNFYIIYFKIFFVFFYIIIGWMILPIRFLKKYNKKIKILNLKLKKKLKFMSFKL